GSARRVDADELGRLDAEVRAEGVLGRAGGLQLLLLGEREPRDLLEATRGVEAGELFAVEGRPLEEVRELRAIAHGGDPELLEPRPGLDLRRRARTPPRRRGQAGSRSA